MSLAQVSPWPWTVRLVATEPHAIVAADGMVVAHVFRYSGGGGPMPKDANARLLARAPELQDQVDECKRQWDQVAQLLGTDGDDVDAVLRHAQAARALADADAELDAAEASLRGAERCRAPERVRRLDRVHAATAARAAAMLAFGARP